MTTGQRIQRARKKAGLSQRQLGEKLGLSASMIGQWENDLRNPKVETLQRIADALLIPFEELLDETSYVAGIYHGAEMETWQRNTILELWKQEGYSGSAREVSLIDAFSQLNDTGQQEAIKRVEELTEIPRYHAENAPAPQTARNHVQAIGGETCITSTGVLFMALHGWRKDRNETCREALQRYCQYLARHGYGKVATEIWADLAALPDQPARKWLEDTFSQYVTDPIAAVEYVLQAKTVMVDVSALQRTPAETGPQAAPASSEGTDTTPPPDGPETPPEGA